MYFSPSKNQIFESHQEIRQAFSSMSLPQVLGGEVLASLGVFFLVDEIPEHDVVIHEARAMAPVNEGGQWVRHYRLVERDPVQAQEILAALKVQKNAEINTARLAANRLTFSHGGKLFACDELSRSDIDGTNGFVALYASMPPGWVGGWKAVDNTFFPIATVQEWASFYTSMFAAGSANFARAQALKAQLAGAQTATQVAAIFW